MVRTAVCGRRNLVLWRKILPSSGGRMVMHQVGIIADDAGLPRRACRRPGGPLCLKMAITRSGADRRDTMFFDVKLVEDRGRDETAMTAVRPAAAVDRAACRALRQRLGGDTAGQTDAKSPGDDHPAWRFLAHDLIPCLKFPELHRVDYHCLGD